MTLEVVALDKKVWKFKQGVVKKARRLASFLRKKGSIEIYLVDDKRMQRLNKQFRGKNKPTNVLSFPKPKGFPGQELGEVYLDPVYIDKKKENLDLMLVHGVLHILGYDHKQKSDRIVMQKKEAELLKRLVIRN
jgi:probable rRNA maturation factor